MSFLKFCTLFGALALTAKVSAHGVVQGIVVNGVYSPGFNPSFTPYQNPVPAVAGWTTQDSDLGFVSDYSSPDIICHKSATPGAAYITVAAGESIELQWTVWPTSHKGPMIDYLASCNGDCTNVDKTTLLFSKIDQAGLIDGSPAPGTWASDTMIANNNSWTVTIPPSIAPGKYVLRHETIALHSAENVGGSQAYPQCINLDITGSGTDSLTTGTLAEDFYTNTDPGILVNIYYPALTNYTIPGPPLLVGAVSASQAGGSPSPPPASSAAAAESAPASSSVPAAAATSSLWAPYANGTWTMTTPTSTPASTSVAPTDTATKDTSPTTSSTTITTTTTTVTLPPSAHASSWSAGMSPSPSPASSQLAVESSPGAAWGPPAASSSSAPASSQIAPASSSEAAWGPPPAASSSPVAGTATAGSFSFSTTFTGRIGKPTKFTCYIDE